MENINTITKISTKKNNIVLHINNNTYPIDSYYYECILPYVGKVLEVSQMLELIAFSSSCDILKKIYPKLFNHSISTFELKQKLKSKEISEDKINLIISFFKQEGYLKEIDFINYYKQIYIYKKGTAAFKRFLESKKISSNAINIALLDYQEDEDVALKYATAYLKNKIGSNKELKLKVYAHLLNKGYSNKTINETINKLCFDNEKENLKIEIKKYIKKYKNDSNKIISKLANKGYNVNDIKNNLKKEGMPYEN